MWRLKLKETLERFTVLDCKNWTCGSGTPKIQQQQQNSSSTTNSASAATTNNEEKSISDTNLLKCKNIDYLSFGPEIFLPSWTSCSTKRNSSSGSSNDDQDGGNRKNISDNEHQLSEDILGAITWSGAIIFGWYASQILCTRRRHQNCYHNDHSKKYLKYLYIPRRTIYSTINSRLVFTSPIQPQNSPTTVTLSNRIKYVDIQLLDNELSASSTNNKNLIKQSQSEEILRENTNSASNSNLTEYSSDSSTSITSRISADREIQNLDNDIYGTSHGNREINKLQPRLHQINNSTDSSESSTISTESPTNSKTYCTDDSSSSFIEFRENSNNFTTSTNNKIYPKAHVTLTDDRGSTAHNAESSSSTKNYNVGKAVSELVQTLGDFEFKIALQYMNKKDYKSALPHLKNATIHSHASAVYHLALFYEKGLGVEKNLNIAREYYHKASHLGNPKATFNLGVFYAKGLGGASKDTNMARKCMITAAKLGQPEAISVLNTMAAKDEEIAKYLKQQKIRSDSIDSGI